MQISKIIGGYTLGGADMLSPAMGKNKPEEMAKHRETIASGLDAAPEAFLGLLKGKNLGKQLVKLV